MNKTLKYIIVVLPVLFLVLGACVFFAPNLFQNGDEKHYLLIREGDDYNEVLKQLKEKANIFSEFTFSQTVNLLNYKENVKPGRYLIKNRAGNLGFVRDLKRGVQTPVQLTFNNVRTKEQLSRILSKQLMADSVQFINLLNDSAYLTKFNLDPNTSISVFLPNTYEVFWNASPQKIFDKMYGEYQRFWNKERKQKAAEIPLSQSEVVTLASIVESESNKSSEKPIIAGLYLNRLKKGMPLQADPTIIFAVGDFSIKRVTSAYTNIDSPYNTYKNKGLPPGPIRVPNLNTIDAVLNYDRNDYIYMCAKETLNGEHNFAVTWQEHQINARKYQQALNQLGIR